MSTPNNEEVLREIVSNAIYRKSFNLLIQNEQLNVLDWSGKVMDVFTRQCEEMRREIERLKQLCNFQIENWEFLTPNAKGIITQLTADLAKATEELARVKGITVEGIREYLDQWGYRSGNMVRVSDDEWLKIAQAIHALYNQKE